MISGGLLPCALSIYLSVTLALPSSPRSSNTAIENSIISPSDVTQPEPYPAHPVRCLSDLNAPKLTPSDCSYVLNELILREADVFTRRRFTHTSYRSDAGGFAPARWSHKSCEVSVQSIAGRSLMLSFVDVALTATKIIQECVDNVRYPLGGLSLIGNVDDGFGVVLRGSGALGSVSEKGPSVSHQPAMGVSRRAIRPQPVSEDAEALQGIETRDPLRGVSRVSNHPAVASNAALSAPALPTYAVNCFNPLIVRIPPAVARDCSYVINQVILRLSDPTRELTFGFTDAADINLSKPEYRKWQHGQCMITLKSDHEGQMDKFRLLDVAMTARRIVTHCVVNTKDKIGGVSGIGTEGKGFYVYVGGPLVPRRALSDVLLLPGDNGGVESL